MSKSNSRGHIKYKYMHVTYLRNIPIKEKERNNLKSESRNIIEKKRERERYYMI